MAFMLNGVGFFFEGAKKVVLSVIARGCRVILCNWGKYVGFCMLTSVNVVVCSVMLDLNVVERFRKWYLATLNSLFRFVNRIVSTDPDIDDMNYSNSADDNTSSSTTSELVRGGVQFSQLDLASVTVLIRNVVKNMVDDQVTKRFVSEEVPNWNMMMRAQPLKLTTNWILFAFWLLGSLFRYTVLLPVRLTLITFTTGVIISSFLMLMAVPGKKNKAWLSKIIMPGLSRLSLTSLGFYCRYHNLENVPKHGIAVANHTTPLDALVVSACGFFGFTGQAQEGFFKLYQKCLEPMGHLFFERSVDMERDRVARELSSRAEDSSKPPILIFPEGTCINNTSVMMFRKRTFEITNVVHPIAIKYHSAYGDAFWNSSSVGFLNYLLRLATSWTILADVWFLPPIQRRTDECTLGFANRVRHAIAERANLVELDWDGQLKRSFVPARLKREAQYNFISRFQPAIMNMYKYTKVDRPIKYAKKNSEHVMKRVSSQHFFKKEPDYEFNHNVNCNQSEKGKNRKHDKKMLRFSDDNLVGLKNFKYWTVGFDNNN